MKKEGTLVYFSLVFAMIFWSLTFVWFKIVNEVYPPFTIVFFRLVISSTVLLVVARFSKVLQKFRKEDFKYFLVLSLFNPLLYFVAESIGLTLISASLAAVIVSTIPLFVPVGAYFFLGERLSLLNIFGILISFVGVLVVLINRGFTFSASTLGVILMVIAVFCAVGYTLIVKKLTNKYNPFSITTYQNIMGIFFFLPLFLIFDFQEFRMSEPTTRAILALIYLAIFGSTIAFILFNYGVKILGAAKADVFTNIIPILTTVFAYFILGEEVTIRKIIGICIVLGGLFLSQFPTVRRRKARIFHSEY